MLGCLDPFETIHKVSMLGLSLVLREVLVRQRVVDSSRNSQVRIPVIHASTRRVCGTSAHDDQGAGAKL